MVMEAPARVRLGEKQLMAHLLRRAGFGATHDELHAALAKGYEAVVDEILHPEAQPDLDEHLMFRYYPDFRESRQIFSAQSYWVYRMINTKKPFEEKMTLFWHGLFATAYFKAEKAHTNIAQIAMLRQNCLGNFRDILLNISKDGAMIYWLDNQENTKDVHNENFGRELLELFSMGIGNYTEDDVKECARAFTGWGLKKTIPGGLPFSHHDMVFQFYPEQHDYGVKTFLGETGEFDGGDIIDIVVRQPATATFLATKLYQFFVSDTPDDAAIAELAEAYVTSGYDLRAVMKALFLSDAFCSVDAHYARVKSPAEHVVGTMRLVGDYAFPRFGIREIARECGYMGQELMNPPSVEGWHTGKEWIDTGILVERVNFAADQVAKIELPGIQRIVAILREAGPLSQDDLLTRCLELLGIYELSDTTREALYTFVRRGSPLDLEHGGERAQRRLAALLQVIVATREYQLA